jgi:transposase InsO family protein
LIVDRDTKYTAQFRRLIAKSKTAAIRLPPRSLDLNAYAERFVRSVKEEWLNRMIFPGQAALRRAVSEFDATNIVSATTRTPQSLIQPETKSLATESQCIGVSDSVVC